MGVTFPLYPHTQNRRKGKKGVKIHHYTLQREDLKHERDQYHFTNTAIIITTNTAIIVTTTTTATHLPKQNYELETQIPSPLHH